MLFLIALILAFGFAFLCGRPLKKYPYVFYAAAVIITAVTVILAGSNLRTIPVFVNTYIIGLFTRGAFATALWCVVMWAGALPNGSAPIKKLMPIRGELSIFAALLTLGHNIGFGQTYFVRLFTDAGKMTSNQISASVMTIIMLVIMIPLTVMSFPQVRKKMNAKLWKRIQRTAYAFYALIYIHVLTLCYPMAKAGREGYLLSIFIYSAVFIGYAACRVRKWYIMRKKPQNTMIVNIICAAAFVLLVAGVTFCTRAEKAAPSANTVQHQAVQVTTTTTSQGEQTGTTTTVSVVSVSNTQTTTSTGTGSETSATTTTVTDVTEADIEEESEPYTEENEPPEETPYEEDSYEQPAEEEPVQVPQPTEAPEPVTEPEPSYVYANGSYSASAYGYDGNVTVTITIENDVITSITGYTDESDDWYYNNAQGTVIPQILATQSTSVDAYSGATYSSEAIMQAVQKALNSAKN